MKFTKILPLFYILFFVFACKKKKVEEDVTTYVPISVDHFLDDWTCSINPGEGGNFNLAEFGLWVPDPKNVSDLKAILVLLGHFNSNTLGLLNSKDWQKYAMDNHLALLAARIENFQIPTDYPYFEAGNGSGDALMLALEAIANKNNIPRVASLSFLFRGYSAGGMFSYYFSAYKPERVIAFSNIRGWDLVNMGDENKNIPALFLLGENDTLDGVPKDIVQQVVLNKRRNNGLWAFAVEPGVDHYSDLDKADSLTVKFFSSVLNLRANGTGKPLILPESSGWLGNNDTHAVFSYTDYPDDRKNASWLPDEVIATAWVDFQKK
jgi:hypothetical protein